MTDIVPAGGTSTAVAPAGGRGGAVVPSTGQPANLPQHLSGSDGRPAAGNSASREINRRGSAPVAYSLADFSNLDEICMHMTLLNQEIGFLLDLLAVLKKGSEALEDTIANVDELARHYEATVMTRSATDADSTICMIIDDLVGASQEHGFLALRLNAMGYEGLAAMRASQDRMRAQGAGPRLLASAGNL